MARQPTLIAYRDKRYILIAKHGVRGVDRTSIRFWCRPATPIREKSAKDVTDAEIGKATSGDFFSIQSVEENATLDVALSNSIHPSNFRQRANTTSCQIRMELRVGLKQTWRDAPSSFSAFLEITPEQFGS